VKLTLEGLELDTTVSYGRDEEPVTLADMVASAVAGELVDRDGWQAVRAQIGAIRQTEIEKQVAAQVAEALEGPLSMVPVTLADVIRAEARAQIEQDPDRYQGISTPLAQVVAAEVYAQLHDETVKLVGEARERIRTTLAEEMDKLVKRQFGLQP